jgi:predicted RND superfamily exporter protein
MLESLTIRVIKLAIPILAIAVILAFLGGYFGSRIDVSMGFKEMVPHDLESMQAMEWVDEKMDIDLIDAAPIIVLVESEEILTKLVEVGDLWNDLSNLEHVRAIRPEFPEEDTPAHGEALITHIYLTEPLTTIELRDEVLGDVDLVLKQYEDDFELTSMGLPVVLEQIQEKLPWEQVKLVIYTIAGLIVILAVGFRKLSAPVIILITLGTALLWTLGIMHVFGIPVTVTTMAIFPLFLGLGIDYCIHFLRRYDEERRQGYSIERALTTSYATTGGAIIIAGITSIVAFVILATSWFVGLRDLGISLAFGTLLCALAAFTVMPSLIAVRERAVVWRRFKRE